MEKETISSFFGLKINGYLFEKGCNGVIANISSFKYKAENEFLDFLGKIPIFFSKSDENKYKFRYTSISSVFDGTNFAAIFFNIFDSNNLEKPRILVIAELSEFSVPRINKEIIELAENIFNDNFLQFKKEIITKIKVLKSQIDQGNLQELLDLANLLSLQIDDEKMLIDDRFLMKKQRNAKELFNSETFINSLEDIIWFSEYMDVEKEFPKNPVDTDFGLANDSISHFLSSASLQDNRSIFVQLASSHNLSHVLCSLLIARPFVVVTKEIERYTPLIVKLSAFIPGFRINNFVVKEQIEPGEMNEGMIAICKELGEEGRGKLSILSIDEKLYEGLICDSKSFIWRFASMDPTQSAPSYVMSSYCKVMKVFYDVEFVFSEINKINDINCFTVESRLCELGYDSCDFRIFAVWARILGFSKVFQELSAKKTFDKIGACFL